MNQAFHFKLERQCFDQNYRPSAHTRLTTNFANLARGEQRQENLCNTFAMINNRFNAMAYWDNPNADRYTVELEIISIKLQVRESAESFPAMEILNTVICDHQLHRRINGMVGNNFSSYLRDYDFNVLLPAYKHNQDKLSLPENYGVLHGQLFQCFIRSALYRDNFAKPPVICLSVSSNKTYHRSANSHPILGVEYTQNHDSLTDAYFAKMGLAVRYFMPINSVAPLAFYFQGDLLSDYTNLELISCMSTMESFQKIYRPEIYNANSPAGQCFRPSLDAQDYSVSHIDYDRVERGQLAMSQAKFTEHALIQPYQAKLTQWLTQQLELQTTHTAHNVV